MRRVGTVVLALLVLACTAAIAFAVPASGAARSSARVERTTAAAGTAAATSPAASTVHGSKTLLGPGSHGAAVLALQRRLVALHYWLGTPNGVFDDATEQAVYALQKVAGITRDGIVGPKTEAALARGLLARPRPAPGFVVEIDLTDDVLMLVDNGRLEWALNTSTGGGYTYWVDGTSALAITPVGRFRVYAEVDGLVTDPLGQLWRPKYFDAGFALHGDSYVPAVPVSHGCVRVSDEAIDWIWAKNLVPIGTEVWIYGGA